MVQGEMPGTVLEVVKGDLNRTHDGQETAFTQRAEKEISQLGLGTTWIINTLSAGMKRKSLLAKALAAEPNILLLDEPTNHMNIDSIKRLEEMLIKFTGALIFVTHDRTFLQRIATRIVEIDRAGYLIRFVMLSLSWHGGRPPVRSRKPGMLCLIKN
jgi:ATP-binding cassette subfamily F protein uup